ncbi:MAG: M48 family metalloprotease [Candidatus Omnitrophica bacterium]|nr:M48 family metalloprotease [Candidatus Omnitrophota bacterium]
MNIKIILTFLIAVTMSGCASLGSYNAATGRQELIFISTPQEVAMGQTVHKQITATEKLSKDSELIARVNRIGKKVASASDRQDYQYHFYVIEKNEINAYTVPGGGIYIYTGLLNELKSDDEIAAVLGHEIGHCAARHTVKKFQAALGYDFLSEIVLSKVDQQMQQLAAMGSGAVMTLVTSAYSRSDEYQADQLGLKYMRRAGYDLNGMVKSFEVLAKEGGGGSTPLILRTHPYIADRIKAVKEEIAKSHN